MASEKQIEANKINLELAGVKTEEGKLKVRHNSYKHGLTGKSIRSDFKSHQEDQQLYESMVQGLNESFGPKNKHEESLIAQMASALWRLRRFDQYEANLWEEDYCLELSSLVLRISKADEMERALRYKASMEAQYYRALSAFIEGRRTHGQLDLFLNFEVSHG